MLYKQVLLLTATVVTIHVTFSKCQKVFKDYDFQHWSNRTQQLQMHILLMLLGLV
jgi:hypothetical protein